MSAEMAVRIRSYPQLAVELREGVRESWLGRYVFWLKSPDDRMMKIGIAALAIAVFSSTIFGLSVVRRGYYLSGKLNGYERLSKLSDTTLTPPALDRLWVRGRTCSFNHAHDFVIHDQRLWCKRRKESRDGWQLMYFDGYLTRCHPIALSADGANLIVLDQTGMIHYKKVLKEKKDPLGQYMWKDLTRKDNWKDRWYTFPMITHLYHVMNEKRLSIPMHCLKHEKYWGVSHRGVHVGQFEDRMGRPCNWPQTVTTLYVVSEDRKHIIYADPWLPNGFNNFIMGPSPEFTIDQISPSGSTLFLKGTTERGETKLYTLLADFDTMGRNPVTRAFWLRSYRGHEEWQEHPVPDGAVIEEISIHQTGVGNGGRQLRIKGTSPKGKAGYFVKGIAVAQWTFSASQ